MLTGTRSLNTETKTNHICKRFGKTLHLIRKSGAPFCDFILTLILEHPVSGILNDIHFSDKNQEETLLTKTGANFFTTGCICWCLHVTGINHSHGNEAVVIRLVQVTLKLL